jgi:hypothetical protein
MVIDLLRGVLVCVSVLMSTSVPGAAQVRARGASAGPESEFSVLVGTPSQRSAVISVLSMRDCDVRIEYGMSEQTLTQTTAVWALKAGIAAHIEISGLEPNGQCFYRVSTRAGGAAAVWQAKDVHSFRTQRERASDFRFTVQGDSHPERQGKMYDPALYVRALTNVAADQPDFHFLMGDDFSIERLIERGDRTQAAVDEIYAHQRGFLGIVGKRSALMLVNGNHEQAAKYLLDGTPDNFAVLAGRARSSHFPLPAPDGFYSGNTNPVEHVGLLRDYYAWEWGDALFVVIDPYWHSDAPVDNEAGVRAPQRDAGRAGTKPDAQTTERRGKGNRDLWQITLGDEQYRWLRGTLTASTAKFKFVFSHHVSGTGRGGVEVAPYYEWGGQDRRGGGRSRDGAASEQNPARGMTRFFEQRPMWEKPIHDLMRDTGVTVFFQGHDHLYARQQLDGVVYQTCPNPADPTFTAFNREAYRTGDVFPNSGHLRVTVTGGTDAKCTVEYVRAARASDEATHGTNGSIVHAYTVKPRAASDAEPALKKGVSR